MDGHRQKRSRWALGLIAACAVGCNRNATTPDQTGMAGAAAGKSSLGVSKLFGGSKPAIPGAPPEQVVVKTKTKPGQPFKAETELALAAVEVDTAFLPGKSATERDELLDAARQTYQRVLKKQPNNLDAQRGLAQMYAKAGDRERAVGMLRAAVAAHPKDHDLAYALAKTQAKFADWAGAAESCKTALALDPENRTYLRTLGFVQVQLGRPDEAFDTLVRVMPEAEARHFLGRALYDLERPTEAREQMELALRADPQHAGAKQFVADLDAGGKPMVPNDGIQTVGHTEPAAEMK